jgi:hypothetical protein
VAEARRVVRVKPHIERPALPWREPKRTLCGLDMASTPVITVTEAASRIEAALAGKDFLLLPVKQRQEAWEAAVGSVICRVCWSKRGAFDWARSPVSVVDWECSIPNWLVQDGHDPHARFTAELRAVADLIAAHREEFDGLVETQETWRALQALSGVRPVRQRMSGTRPG